ncbi:CCAAT/enhancer-binding protein [Harmonia axyridis]|uniref:CCAAT/enhancer-binding protein n=1 Tax=Harmonia axyridis TaxID=115357 RepID=UPI001E276485|nr:CCAAT/enhancer-binding protein [Harmonia axyridis]
MESPQMYDNQQNNSGLNNNEVKKSVIMNNNNNLTTLNNNGSSKQTATILKQHQLQQFQQHGELNDLSSPEISLDLHNLIDDSHFSDGLFSDILQSQSGKHLQNIHTRQVGGISANSYPRTTLAYMPQPVHSGATYSGTQNSNSDSNSSVASDVPSIKEEPIDPQEIRRMTCNLNIVPNSYMPGVYPTNPNATFTTLTPSPVMHHGLSLNAMKSKSAMMSQHVARKSVKPCDKNSDEYRRRRERNNIAVRKSREKAKVRTRETEEKVKLLMKDNEKLVKKIDALNEELSIMRNFINNNMPGQAELFHREFNKQLDHLHIQQQHMSDVRHQLMDMAHDYGP